MHHVLLSPHHQTHKTHNRNLTAMLPAPKNEEFSWLITSEPDGDLVLRDDVLDEIRKEWETFLKTYHTAHDGNPEPIDLPPQK